MRPPKINNTEALSHPQIATTESAGRLDTSEPEAPNFTLSSELLNEAVDTGLGPTSVKLVHPEFPGVVIRQLHPGRIAMARADDPTRTVTRNEAGFIDSIRQKYRDHYGELSSHDIEVPSFSVLQGEDGEVRIVTHKVLGVPLEEALAKNLPGAIAGLNKDVHGELGYLRAVKKRGTGLYLSDTAGLQQRMFGHYAGETENDDRVILIDIDPDEEEGFRQVSELEDAETYLDSVTKLAFDIVKAESLTRTTGMQSSRQAVRAELERIISNERGRAGQLARDVLHRLDTDDVESLQEYMDLGF